MDEVFRLFEALAIIQYKFINWYALNDDNFDHVMKMFDLGMHYQLHNRDLLGRRIICIQLRKFDVNRFTFDDYAS